MPRVILLLAFVALVGCHRGPSGPEVIAITEMTLLDGTARPPIDHAALVVYRGKVLAMGPETETRIPNGATEFRSRGRFVFPPDPTQQISVGGDASFLILTVNPALDMTYPQKIVGRMQQGRWTQYPR